MGNLISNKQGHKHSNVDLSNGGTSVLVSFLALAGSRLAKVQSEIDLITWLVSRDQGVLGVGVVGFDLSDMPWSKNCEEFDRQKKFLRSVISRIRSKVDVQFVEYNPPYLETYTDCLNKLLDSFEFSMVSQTSPEWCLLPNKTLDKCEKHGVFLHEAGCVVCNDG